MSKPIDRATSVLVAGLMVALAYVAWPAKAATASSTATPATASSTANTGAKVPSKAEAPFARVYLAVRGCMSCSHCRTSIRQMLRANSEGGETRFGDDQIEVIYAKPTPVPLRDVIRSLAGNRLHDLSVVDVLFEARGVIRTSEKGAATFALAGTGQTFPLTVTSAAPRPSDGTPVRLVALVDGWRENGVLSLQSKEIVAAN